ncbi:MAG: indolepyruvate oxidoreductase subunit beta [Lachnospiraceae bacterium]|nr:indolepyruvate oxidoreductase subunit beta [Lachnospiraceae bacterium]
MSKSVILCGVGGQGTVLASKLISYAAMAKGEAVRSAETIGMAQRGGSVTSHIRIGEGAFSPLIPKGKADVMIAFEPAEAVRNLDYLRPDGVAVVSMKAVKPVTASLSSKEYEGQEMLDYLEHQVKRLVIVDGQQIMEELGSAKILNVILLGAAIGCHEIDISVEEIAQAIKEKVPERFYELNLRALEAGYQLATK